MAAVPYSLRQRLLEAEKLFRKACEQFTVLNRHVEELNVRFREADISGHRVLRYNIRLRLSVIEGVRNMFYEYAAMKSTEIIELQRRVLEDATAIDDDSDSDISDIAELISDDFTSSDYDDSSASTDGSF